ncbi:MAG TPA: cupredoxin domain-containing protein [Gaiellaceae bacterium]
MFLLPLAAALVLTAAACGGGGNKSSESEGGTTTIAGQAANDHGSKDVSGESKAEIEMYDFYFEPTVLTGKPGQTIMLELKNEGKAEHNLTISGQSVDKNVAAGEEAEVDVTFPQSGTLAFYCKFHQSRGMAGGLTVSGSSSSGGGTSTSENTSTGY